MAPAALCTLELGSRFGSLTIISSDLGVAQLRLPNTARAAADAQLARYFGSAVSSKVPSELARYAAEELEGYLAGRTTRFDVPLDLRLTPFANRVLQLLRKVPWGKTTTYGRLARHLGKPLAARAVGWAVAHNPLPLFIPCHRVLPARGGLGDYGGGVELKRALLALEGVTK